MAMKNFKAEKNYRKRANPTKIQVLPKDGKRQMKFDKSKLPAMICKGGPMVAFAVAGYFVGSFPGVMIGAIVGQQVGKFLFKFLEKKPKKKRSRY